MSSLLASQVVAAIKVGLLVFDQGERLVMSNAWFDRHAGWDRSPVGSHFAELFPALVGGRTQFALRHALDDGWSAHISNKLNRTPFPLYHRTGPLAGTLLDQLVEIVRVDDGGSGWALVVVHDQSNAAQQERVLRAQAEELRKFSFVDGLTGIPNRRRFDEYLANETRRACRAGAPLALLMLDVDHFKRFNDALGHIEGDACLRRVAQIAAAQLARPSDLLARYGGEEFAAVLPDTDLTGAINRAERIRAAVEQAQVRHPASPIGPHVTVSIGAAMVAPRAISDGPALLAAADQALYRAKEGGRNRVSG